MSNNTPTLDHDSHVYTLDGQTIPGVTTVLQPIIDYSDIDPQVLANKARLGTYVHYATELVDDGSLDFDTLDAALLGYVNAWVKFKSDTGFIIEQSEHVIYHKRYRYAGTLDRVGIINGTRAVLDIKCVVTLTDAVGVQLAAYQEAENSIRKAKDSIDKRFALQLKPNGHYKLERYKNNSDFNVFTSLLVLHNWRITHAK